MRRSSVIPHCEQGQRASGLSASSGEKDFIEPKGLQSLKLTLKVICGADRRSSFKRGHYSDGHYNGLLNCRKTCVRIPLINLYRTDVSHSKATAPAIDNVSWLCWLAWAGKRGCHHGFRMAALMRQQCVDRIETSRLQTKKWGMNEAKLVGLSLVQLTMYNDRVVSSYMIQLFCWRMTFLQLNLFHSPFSCFWDAGH